ncbi:MAG: uracil-DNA glycosylase [Bacteroidales bacterium]|nr:uracil-DNA glycosylase [Bacteroidales bacterium]MDI9575758.1 uracil-DNA glycosylase [Bacteroidota bacterium]MDD2592886.1 uracil-DNA glycosylase [Bacteroidales bacterium]MDD3755347.1 uracil-DNA glycosylase [Bacteroidales bacterium]MDY0401021.1 uracil-DNA glycosylase [Bacteroidales bacterium]
MNPIIEKNWKEILWDEFQKPYFKEIKKFLIEEKKKYRVFPPGSLMFNAFNLTPFNKVKVVIIGQDPYHGYGQAHGLCFSVPKGVTKPPSLINIFKELKEDLGIDPPNHGDLSGWAKQGVFLINAILTVRENAPESHRNIGWEKFTNKAIQSLSEKKKHLVFMLWGAYAQEKEKLIDPSKHLILKAAHPSPYSAKRGFFGCHHFSKANQYLIANDIEPIRWSELD